MCSVSMMYDWGKQQLPQLSQQTWDLNGIAILNFYKQIIELAKKLDELSNQKDCEDPSKAIFLAELEARVKKLEDGRN